MDDLKHLEALGLTLPSPAYLIGALLFGIIGYLAYRHGKKTATAPIKWIGLALMLFPYAVADTWLLYTVGAALCAGLYFLRR